MTVLPHRINFFLNCKEIYQFLLACQHNCSHCPNVVSLSLEIPHVDPLAVLHTLAKPDQLSFYFENKSKREAVVAIDAVAKVELEGKERFYYAQKFINSCLSNTSAIGDINLSFAGPHFFCSFSFFDEKPQKDYPFPAATVFLPRWQVACKRDCCVLVANLIIDADINLEMVAQDLWQTIQIISSSTSNSNTDRYIGKLIKENANSITNFRQAVTHALELIKNNHFNKVVLAHTLDIEFAAFSILNSLNNLRSLHPDCYVFSVSNGKGQNFIGASPERLVNIYAQRLTTDALAGSAPRGKTSAEDVELGHRLLTNEKERREHQVVVDFINQSLYELSIVPNLLPAKLKQLSNIQHLWTPIYGKIPANVHPLEIVAKLHPTPAVAGDSRDTACAAIRQYERFERGLYAAPLGWIDQQGNSEFIVGIRSALIDGDHVRLYAGAGIVAGSDPDKELAEIQLKLQALLRALV